MPIFENQEDVARWLDVQSHEIAAIFAVRSALRVLPFLPTQLNQNLRGREIWFDSVLPVFRALSISWEVVRYRFTGPDVHAAVAASGRAAFPNTESSMAALAAVRAVGNPGDFFSALDAYTRASNAFSNAGFVVFGSADSAYGADAAMLEDGGSPSDLAKEPLWHGHLPRNIRTVWEEFANSLLAAHEGWRFWVEWYERRIKGVELGERSESVVLAVPDDAWRRGANAANLAIYRALHGRQQMQDKFEFPIANEPDRNGGRPTIPKSRPAAVQPLWRKGRLSIVQSPTKTDLSNKKFLAALAALQVELHNFAEDIGVEANVDRRFVSFIEALAGRIPGEMPSQDELFRLGHVERILAVYANTVNREWPDFLASRYHAISLQFDRTLRQSSLWREFKRNAAKEILSNEQIASATSLAQAAANALRQEEAVDFVDPIVPNALDELGQTLQRTLESQQISEEITQKGTELLAIDLIESVNNTLKPIAEVALSAGTEYAKGFGRGLKSAARKQGPRDGEKAFKWLRRITITTAVGGGVAATGVYSTLSRLIAQYPQAFDWLERVLHFLK